MDGIYEHLWLGLCQTFSIKHNLKWPAGKQKPTETAATAKPVAGVLRSEVYHCCCHRHRRLGMGFESMVFR
jgi:hypothetical protein